jgi:hypothetical protein
VVASAPKCHVKCVRAVLPVALPVFRKLERRGAKVRRARFERYSGPAGVPVCERELPTTPTKEARAVPRVAVRSPRPPRINSHTHPSPSPLRTPNSVHLQSHSNPFPDPTSTTHGHRVVSSFNQSPPTHTQLLQAAHFLHDKHAPKWLINIGIRWHPLASVESVDIR